MSSARSTKASKEITGSPFTPYEISPSTAHLSILLLKSKEPEVLCSTLKALSIFAKQDHENKVLLDRQGVVEGVLPHIDHPQLNVRRFALLTLAYMCELPQVPEKVLENPINMKRMAYQLVKVEDVFTLEYASLCLARLTTCHEGCRQLVEANILGTLCKRMKDSLDPDVQKNCLQTLSNLVEDPLCASEVTRNPFFNWASILVLTKSKFISLQNAALKMVGQLICRRHDAAVQSKFRASTGVFDLCDILESYEFRDVHEEVLKILKDFVVMDENAAHLCKSECIPRLQSYLELALPLLKPHCLAVLTTLSFTATGRDTIMATDTDLIFCEWVLSSSLDMYANAALGVANMCELLESAVRMCDTGVAEGLCSILVDDCIPWFNVRINTLKALVRLSRLTMKSAVLVTRQDAFRRIRLINIHYKDHPEEAQHLALKCFYSLLTYANTLKAMLNADFISELLDVIKRVNIRLQIKACRIMSVLTKHELGKDLFTINQGEEVVSDNLKIDHNGLRKALCELIIESATAEGTEVYVELGTIKYMMDNLAARYMIGSWDEALALMFKLHPSAKFAYLGRLEPDDFTNDGFYVQKRLGEDFPSISKLIDRSPPVVDPVYVAILNPNHRVRDSVDSGIRTPYIKFSRGYLSSISMSNRNLMTRLPDDLNLKSYVAKLRYLLGDPSRSIHYIEILNAHYDVRERHKCQEVGSTLKKKAQILADFVVQEMSGDDQAPESGCCMPSVSLHIAELVKELDNGIIGVGFIRYGGLLERAVLYKVLADRLGIPCSLNRKCSAKAWCEVAVPEVGEGDEYPEQKFTAKYLRVNYVVDLSDNVENRLFLLGGHEANKICGPPLPPYVVGKQASST